MPHGAFDDKMTTTRLLQVLRFTADELYCEWNNMGSPHSVIKDVKQLANRANTFGTK